MVRWQLRPAEIQHLMKWLPGVGIFVKVLEGDKETGMTVFLVRYPAGFVNSWHTHPTAHGMHVLDGVLKTHQGEYGPGTWVWFPEGGWMEHGATPKNEVTLSRLPLCATLRFTVVRT